MKRRLPFLTLLLMALCQTAFAQPYLSYYDLPGRVDRLNDMSIVSEDGYAVLTESRLLWLDQQGNITREWIPEDPDNAFLHKMVLTSNGKYCLLATPPNKNLQLYILRADGTLERKKELSIRNAIWLPKMEAGLNGKFYITCIVENVLNRIQVMQMNEDGNMEWVRVLPDGLEYTYDLLGNQQGGLELSYLTPGSMVLRWGQFDTEGNYTSKDITGMSMDDLEFPVVMTRKADGGLMLAGYQVWGARSGDVLLMEVDAAGNVQRRHVVDICNDDYPTDLHCDRNGCFLLTESGKRSNIMFPQGFHDFVLTRFDFSGNVIWKKAYGHPERDEIPLRLLVSGNNLIMGGYTIKEGEDFPGALLIGTGLDGDLQDHLFPGSLETVSSLQRIQLNHGSWTDELTHAVPTPDGGYICGGKYISKGGDDDVASVFKINANGTVQWVTSPAEIFNSQVLAVKPATDGNFLALVKIFTGFQQAENWLFKLNADGQLLWLKQVAIQTAGDFVVTSDGGYLVTGSVFSNNHPRIALDKLNANGDRQWLKTYGANLQYTEGIRIGIDANAKVVVAAVSGPTAFTHKGLCLLKTEQDGTLISEKLAATADSVYVPNALLLTTDKEVLIGGYAQHNNSLSKNAWLIHFNAAGEQDWLRNFNISHTDEVTALLPMGETGYYFAGTTNEPDFGSRKHISFVSTIKKDGTPVESFYFGDQQSAFSIAHLFKGTGNRIHFLANRFEQYHTSYPVMGVAEPDIILSATPPNREEGIRLYPNPSKSWTILAMNNQYNGDVQVSFIAMNGMRLKNMVVKKHAAAATFRIPLSGIPKGMCQVEIRYGNTVFTKSLLVLP